MDASNNDIVIVGGGAAGLMCARELLMKGSNVTILEANDRLGGRIHTIRNAAFENAVEEGCEFVHGNLPLTIQLLKEAHIDHRSVKGVMIRIVNGEWHTQDDFTLGWKELIEQMNEVREDITIDDFLKRHFSDDKYKGLRTSVLRFAQGFDLADTSRASVLALREEWMDEEDEQYRIPGGNDQLINYLEKQFRGSGGIIHTNSPVSAIKWRRNSVIVSTDGNKTYVGNKVILTISLGLLQSEPGVLDFQPGIKEYLAAARKIGFGSVIKVLLQFKEPFWEEKKKNIGFLFADTPIPTWWTQLPSSYPLLTGWVGGPQAWDLQNKDDHTVLQSALNSLSTIFQKPVQWLEQLLTASHVANWRTNPFARGAYSYSTVESEKAQELFATSIQGTIYFAGEAFYNGPSPGTLEAALVSARNVVEKIMGDEL